MATKRSRKVWMRVPTEADIDRLRELLADKGTTWQRWEYKLYQGNIIIHSPVTPWDHKTRKPDPSREYMAKQLRIVPVPGGPFQLEYMRHTGQWWPLGDCTGDIEAIAGFIAEDAYGLCCPLGSDG